MPNQSLPTLTLLASLLLHLTTAIINGTAVTSPAYSYTVALSQPGLALRDPDTFICTGVLISPTTVLTIAECVHGIDAAELVVSAVGAGLDCNDTSAAGAYQNATVASITTHPGFSYTTLKNDVAILRLGAAFSGIVPATLPPALSANSSNGASNTNAARDSTQTVTLIGWGPNTATSHTQSPNPLSGAVDTLSHTACAARLAPCYALDEQHFCINISSSASSSTSTRANGTAANGRTADASTGGGVAQAYGDGGGAVVDAQGVLVGLIGGNPACAAGEGVALEVLVAAFEGWVGAVGAGL